VIQHWFSKLKTKFTALMFQPHGTKTCLSKGHITKTKHQSLLYCTKPFLTDNHLEYETKTFSEVLTEELEQAEWSFKQCRKWTLVRVKWRSLRYEGKGHKVNRHKLSFHAVVISLCLHILGPLLYCSDLAVGGSSLHQNVGNYLQVDVVWHSRSLESLLVLWWERAVLYFKFKLF